MTPAPAPVRTSARVSFVIFAVFIINGIDQVHGIKCYFCADLAPDDYSCTNLTENTPIKNCYDKDSVCYTYNILVKGEYKITERTCDEPGRCKTLCDSERPYALLACEECDQDGCNGELQPPLTYGVFEKNSMSSSSSSSKKKFPRDYYCSLLLILVIWPPFKLFQELS